MAKKKVEQNPIEEFRPRKFVCSRWPYLSVGGGVKFSAGYLTIDTEEKMARLRRADAFRSGQIVEIKERNARQRPTVEESAELAAIEELKQLQPKAHRGMVSTSNMAG